MHKYRIEFVFKVPVNIFSHLERLVDSIVDILTSCGIEVTGIFTEEK